MDACLSVISAIRVLARNKEIIIRKRDQQDKIKSQFLGAKSS